MIISAIEVKRHNCWMH